VWWFAAVRGYGTGRGVTYVRHELDDQPPVPAESDLSWLEDEDAKPKWSIAEGDAVRALTRAGLDALAGGLPIPSLLRLLAARVDLQRRVRSATACLLELGDFAVASSAGDGYLIRVPSASSWA
jgi:hypothetical protein